MLILKIRALLADEKQIGIRELDNILKRVQSEEEFDEAIKPFIRSSPRDFQTKWANHGVAETSVTTWEHLLNTHYRDVLEYSIQARSKVKLANLRNNYTAVSKIAKDAITILNSMHLGFGEGRITSIERAISESVRLVFQNNKTKYINDLQVDEIESSVNHTLVAPLEEEEEPIESRLERLDSVHKAEVKAILFDIADCGHIYRFRSTTGQKVNEYSIYESFLRIHFKMQLSSFNQKYRGHFSMDPEAHQDVKYRKYDLMMENLYKDFIIPGIAFENISELQHAVFYIQKNIWANHANPIFGQTEFEYNPVRGGNFNTGYIFASKGTATEKFDKFIRGIIAISRLYHYLSDAGISPYQINPDIFKFSYEDPSEKFSSLKDLVLYSDTYVKVKEKYGLTGRRSELKALEGVDASGFVLTLDTDSRVIANRNSIQLENLASSILNLLRTEMSYVTMVLSPPAIEGSNYHFAVADDSINLFSLVECIEKARNPLYFVFKGSEIPWEPIGEDPDECLDMKVIQSYYSELLKINAVNYTEINMSRNYLEQMITESDSPFSVLVKDILNDDYEVNSKIILAIQEFAFDFAELLQAFEDKYQGIEHISEMEYSTFLYKHKLLQPLHEIVDVKEQPRKDESVVISAIQALLKRYYPEITVDKLNRFFEQDVKNVSYSNFLNWIKARSFSDLLTHFHYAKANLFNLSDYGIPIKLGKEALERAIANAVPVLNIEDFNTRFGNIKLDRQGYLINDIGELYQVIDYKNKIGALHTNGYFIFTDGDTLPWMEGLK